MDLSKLPKLSQTPAPPSNPTQAESSHTPGGARFSMPQPAFHRDDLLIDVWISGIVGLLLALFGRHFFAWLIALLSGRVYDTGLIWMETGAPNEKKGVIRYFEVNQGIDAWTDTGFAVMGAALLLEALVLLIAVRGGVVRKPLVAIAIGVGLIGLIANLVACGMLLKFDIMPTFSLLATALGGFVIFRLVRLMHVGTPVETSPPMM